MRRNILSLIPYNQKPPPAPPPAMNTGLEDNQNVEFPDNLKTTPKK